MAYKIEYTNYINNIKSIDNTLSFLSKHKTKSHFKYYRKSIKELSILAILIAIPVHNHINRNKLHPIFKSN